MNTTLAIALLASLLVLCSNSGSAHYLREKCGHIREDFSASVGPWTALLHENGTIFCAGTLITDAFILTAASCIRENDVYVRLGEYGRYATEIAEDHKVQMSLRNRLFNRESLANNIGLLKLTKRVQLKEYIMPICIILDPQQQQQPSHSQFIGNAWTLDSEEYLTKEFGPIAIQRKPERCPNLDLYTQFCAGHSGNSESCDGLMGSPLIQNYRYLHKNRHVQFGIATESDMDCQATQAYTDVLRLYWWIQDVLSLFDNRLYDYKPKQSYVVGDNVKTIV
ncbi:serine protease grass [Drosophila teissieri]|uniref:serine protease grass n=1 Tax=Drosophila teissieri TaxID=7243 RepID=UPI001CBA5387|nr:serine protease grass [Drosophila teissieri]